MRGMPHRLRTPKPPARSSPLRFLPGLVLLSALLAGCGGGGRISRPEEFGPTTLRIHPTFTRVKDWSGDKKADGVEAVVELLDSFGEPTRGNGTVVFELYYYRKYDPNVLGNRTAGPWRGPLLTREDQDGHWSPALRAYTFQLAGDKIGEGQEYVLTASFETAGGADRPGGGRLYDKLILEPPPNKAVEDRGVGRAKGRRS
ncbi:MAG: hypothetical protein JWO31_1258 [Phycisphaerales bacterium]|nr:hypothetical protein [Phycisphaerales bacterium]